MTHDYRAMANKVYDALSAVQFDKTKSVDLLIWCFKNMDSNHLQKYIDYIKNTGQEWLSIEQFDDDWAPIGFTVRQDMLLQNMIEERDGKIRLISCP